MKLPRELGSRITTKPSPLILHSQLTINKFMWTYFLIHVDLCAYAQFVCINCLVLWWFLLCNYVRFLDFVHLIVLDSCASYLSMKTIPYCINSPYNTYSGIFLEECSVQGHQLETGGHKCVQVFALPGTASGPHTGSECPHSPTWWSTIKHIYLKKKKKTVCKYRNNLSPLLIKSITKLQQQGHF